MRGDGGGVRGDEGGGGRHEQHLKPTMMYTIFTWATSLIEAVPVDLCYTVTCKKKPHT